MSTSLAMGYDDKNGKYRYNKSWKNRGVYGVALRKKLDYLLSLFEVECKKEKPNIPIIIDLSRSIDFNISVQLSNIRAIEEFETLEKLETWKNELLSKIGSKGLQEAVLPVYKY